MKLSDHRTRTIKRFTDPKTFLFIVFEIRNCVSALQSIRTRGLLGCISDLNCL